jgi:hypothetical protein
MLALVATKDPRGTTPSDRDFALDGELVTPVVLECPDPHCDVCARAWFGLVSHGGTTTAMIVDRPDLDESQLRRALHGWLDCQGTIDLIVQAADDGEYEVDGVVLDDPVMAVDELIDAHVAEIRSICDCYEVGTILSRMGTLVAPRRLDRAA